MEFFIINDIDKKGGAEGAIKRISKDRGAEAVSLSYFGVQRGLLFVDSIKVMKGVRIGNVYNCFLEYTTILFLLAKLLRPSIVVNVWIRSSATHRFGRINEFLYYKLLILADELVFQNRCQREEYIELNSGLNRVPYSFFKEKRSYPSLLRQINFSPSKYMYAGRLEYSKGILEIIEWCIDKEYHLLIYGYGSLESEVIEYSRSHANIHYKGKYQSFFALEEYGKLIMNSSYEGYPNVLSEALHLRIPIFCRRYSKCVEEDFPNRNIVFFDNITEL